MIKEFALKVLCSVAYCAGFIVGFTNEIVRCIGEMIEEEKN